MAPKACGNSQTPHCKKEPGTPPLKMPVRRGDCVDSRSPRGRPNSKSDWLYSKQPPLKKLAGVQPIDNSVNFIEPRGLHGCRTGNLFPATSWNDASTNCDV